MKKQVQSGKIEQLIALLIVFLSFAHLQAQSLNGNVAMEINNVSVSYGTVDVYKGEKLVSSVLTDLNGNFKVPLDSGTYRCEIRFSGCEPIVQTFKVDKDVNNSFHLKTDKKSKTEDKIALGELLKKPQRKEGMGGAMVPKAIRTEEIVTFSDAEKTLDTPISMDTEPIVNKGKGGKYNNTAQAGVLTGGEINDFSKLKMWQDLVEHELSTYRKLWKMFPQNRYVVQLTTPNGLPLTDAMVELTDGSNKIIYRARTDNSGKAELWAKIGDETPNKDMQLKAKITYMGKTEKIRQIKPFSKGLNYVQMEGNCEQSMNVDIAFVVDATGSMGDEINYLKKELNEVVFQTKQINTSLNFRFANVFYRDRGDEYLVKQSPFTRILSESADFVSAQAAKGGGDYEEAVEVALDSAINKLQWNTEARARILFVVLDAPPHNTPENRLRMEKLMRQAAEKGIRIVPLAASGINKSTEYLMRVMALATNGTYLFLTDNSKVGNKHLAPSTDEIKVEKVNQLLARIITSYIYMPDCEQNMPDMNLNYPDSLVEVPNPTDSLKDSNRINEPIFSWSYYPNPSFGLVNIVANQDIKELYLTDLSGKVLQVIDELKANEIKRIDLSNYASGIYLIRYPKGDDFVSGKLILVRDS